MQISDPLFQRLMTTLTAWDKALNIRMDDADVTLLELDLHGIYHELQKLQPEPKNNPKPLDTSKPEYRNISDNHPHAPFAGEKLTRLDHLPDCPNLFDGSPCNCGFRPVE